MFDGLEMVEPGITQLVRWWPDGPQLKPLMAAHRIIAGGIKL
ncbi:hypothetical protein [Amycolatopsis sp. NPDC001319]